MQLKCINIENYLGLNNLNLKFTNTSYNYFRKLQLSILVGENGIGKTSILKLLANIFCPNN